MITIIVKKNDVTMPIIKAALFHEAGLVVDMAYQAGRVVLKRGMPLHHCVKL